MKLIMKKILFSIIAVSTVLSLTGCTFRVENLYSKAFKIMMELPSNPDPDAAYFELLNIYTKISEANVPDSLKGHAYYSLSLMDGESGRPVDTPHLDWLQKAADTRNTEAIGTLGAAYYAGAYGLSRDEQKALDYLLVYDKASSHNIRQANDALGVLYYEGKLVEHDVDKAAGYLTPGILPAHKDLGSPLPDFSSSPNKNLLAHTYVYKANLLLFPTKIKSKWVQIGDRPGSIDIRSFNGGEWNDYMHNVYNAHYYYRCAQQLGVEEIDLTTCIQVLEQFLKTYEKYVNDGRKMDDSPFNRGYVLRSTYKRWERLNDTNYWGQTNGIKPSGWGVHHSANKQQCWLAIGQWSEDITKGTVLQLSYTQEQGFSMFVGSLKFVHNSWSNSWEGYNSGIYYGHDGQIKKY